MKTPQKKLKESLSEYFAQVSEQDWALRTRIKRLELTVEMYKSGFEMASRVPEHSLFVSIYSRDNREGGNLDTCTGVFTSKFKAIKHQLDLNEKNKDIDLRNFSIDIVKIPEQEFIDMDEKVEVHFYQEEHHGQLEVIYMGISFNKHFYFDKTVNVNHTETFKLDCENPDLLD